MVAKENVTYNENIDINLLYDFLTPGVEAYRSATLMHPIFIMFETKRLMD